MKQFLQFILENWQFLVYVLVSVISTILVVVLKKKKTVNELDNILKIVLANLPRIITSVEELIGAGNGKEKKDLVLAAVVKFVNEQFSLNLPDSLIAYIGERIEDILATPQKKGILCEKKVEK